MMTYQRHFDEESSPSEAGYGTVNSSNASTIHEENTRSRVTYGGAGTLFAVGTVALVSVVAMTSSSYSGSKFTSVMKSFLNLEETTTKPNIVFILADDVGYNSLSSDVTPALMKLKESGVTIEKYYTQESSTPARASLLTGRHPLTLGMQKFEHNLVETGGLSLDETTIAEVLKDNGYSTYMFGKWNLGNASPRYLPTARGFDRFLGFLDGYNNYWSKTNPVYSSYVDFMSADSTCFNMYDGEDMHEYSTTLYGDKAVEVIDQHDFTSSPLFLYMSFQAAQNPFSDSDTSFPSSLEESDIDADVYKYISKKVSGVTQQEYFKSLYMLDAAVDNIYNALVKANAADNTVFIFASDNGGCPGAGGRNTPLRGTKGSLFEGGIKVNSFISSPLFSSLAGTSFYGLFHVSDWFPTILGMAGVTYTPEAGYELDGYNQYSSIVRGAPHPRTYMVINYYYDPAHNKSTYWNNAPVAVRNGQYKLVFTYESKTSGDWYTEDEVLAVDDNTNMVVGCDMATAWGDGQYKYFLFDIENDPYETRNLYNTNAGYMKVQETLLGLVNKFQINAKSPIESVASEDCFKAWDQAGSYVVPWRQPESASVITSQRASKATYPQFCGMYSKPSTVAEADAYTEAVTEIAQTEPEVYTYTTAADSSTATTTAATMTSSADATTTTTTTETATVKTAESDKKPNIVFVLADDLGYGSFNEKVSPFLSSLREESIILSNYYTQETCTPARASLLTGRYPITVGWQKYESSIIEPGGLDLDETTFPELLHNGGYTTYMYGKWNLGNNSPRYLPTARGFDYFLGYMDGSTNYWSKTNPNLAGYVDFMYADKFCYYTYDGPDLNDYSSTLYGNKAADAISSHDFETSPMFMYLSYQAVHNPFADTDSAFPQEVPASYIANQATYTYIKSTIKGTTQQEYYMALAILDESVSTVYQALSDRGVLDNTYMIFASDNGGCPGAGGRNLGLRGTKGSLFEGGVKVDSFIFSPSLDAKFRGYQYTGLFHVSDWFPTILDMASISYTPSTSYFALDGVSQLDAMINQGKNPREYLLYNYYYDPGHSHSTYWNTVPAAIRNSRYKLMHTYNSPTAGDWYNAVDLFMNDDVLTSNLGCEQAAAWADGAFVYYLFDLQNDPSETTNLYDSSDAMKAVQAELYAQLDTLAKKVAMPVQLSPTAEYMSAWEKSNNYVVPWEQAEEDSSLMKTGLSYPSACGAYSNMLEYKTLLDQAANVPSTVAETVDSSSESTTATVMTSSSSSASAVSSSASTDSASSSSSTENAAITSVVHTVPVMTEFDAEMIKTLTSSTSETEQATSAVGKPNIVFVIADAVGYNSLSADVTPYLQRMKADGISLDNYYTQDSSTPARASLLTGRLPLSLGMQKFDQKIDAMNGLPLEETTIADVLKHNGYSTYLLGKWNLGNASPRYLPTARGFDSFLGFMDSSNNYWSKYSVSYPTYKDFMYADTKCYYMYDVAGSDDYSTNMYRIRAVDAINAHNFDNNPMFMMLSFQAAQGPFSDVDTAMPSSVPEEYIRDTVSEFITSTYQGHIQQEYYKSLAVLDDSVQAIYVALQNKGVLKNSYVVFVSDTGGCPAGGGRNTPLRGSKGSLFEGGTKVNAFITSGGLIAANLKGTSYTNIFHVSDWFPTILSMAGVTYTPTAGYELDGFSHASAIVKPGTTAPRAYLMYNYYYDPTQVQNTMWNNVPMAIRNNQYKLMHTYGSTTTGWYGATLPMDGDDNLGTLPTCDTDSAWADGEFTYYLFDLVNDPNETKNLYDSSDEMKAVQKYFYTLMDKYTAKAKTPMVPVTSDLCFLKWNKYNNYVVPFEEPEDASTMIDSKKTATYPNNCGSFQAQLTQMTKFIENEE